MNKSQTRAFRFLVSNGIDRKDIQYTGGKPTFTTTDGRGFMVKYLQGKTATFTDGEVPKLLSNLEKNYLLLVSDTEGVKQVPVRMLEENMNGYEDYKFVHPPPRSEQDADGYVHDIIHPVTIRKNSRHYRINHFHMDSMTVFPEGYYHLKKSIIADGQLKFYFICSPNTAMI